MPQTGKTLTAMRETWVQSLGREDPLEEGMATDSSPRGHKEWDTTERPSTALTGREACWEEKKGDEDKRGFGYVILNLL